MEFTAIILILAGLILFETITSIDNAIINAEGLSTMSERARRWFLVWGLLIAVFAIRGLLPLLIVWLSTPELSPVGAFFATFSSDPLGTGSDRTVSPDPPEWRGNIPDPPVSPLALS